MLKAKKRWVIYMRANLRPIPADGPLDIPMGQALRRLAGLLQAGRLIHTRAKDQQIVRLAEIEWFPAPEEPTHACLLFTYGDVTGADPSFGHMGTGAVRTARKRANEANAVSAHLLVKLRYRIADGLRWYDALLEDVPGIGRSKIQPAVTAMLRDAAGFHYRDPEGQPAVARPALELMPKNSEDLLADLQRGKLRYFLAVKPLPNEELDEEAGVDQVQETRKLVPAQAPDSRASLRDMLRKVLRWANREGFDQVRLVYARHDGQGKTVTLDSPREDAEDLLINKIDEIELDAPIDQATEHVQRELVQKMLQRLR